VQWGEDRSGSGDLEIVAPGVGLTVTVKEDEAFDGRAYVAAEFAVFQLHGGALAERKGL